MNKKIFLLVIALIGFGFSVNATEGSCRIPGTNDYVHAFLQGNTLTVVNGSSRTLASVRVVVMADVPASPEGFIRSPLFDGVLTSIPPQGSQIRQLTTRAIDGRSVRNIEISVSNPVCR